MHQFRNPRPNHPEFDPPSLEGRGVMVFAAFLISAALLGGLVGLFQQSSNEAALAPAASPAAAASTALAVPGPSAQRGSHAATGVSVLNPSYSDPAPDAR